MRTDMAGLAAVLAGCGTLCGPFCGVAAADEEAVLSAAKDNTLYESADGGLSNGAGEFFFVGLTDGNESRRGLIAFDIAGAVPEGSTIKGVTLELEMSKTIVGDQEIGLHRTLADWGEGASDAPKEEGGGADSEPGDATWKHTFYDALEWASLGGDYRPQASAVQTVGGLGMYVWGSTEVMTADVQGWLDDPAGNFGWLLLGPEDFTSAKRFNTRENAKAQTRPRLRVQFVLPCYADCDASGLLDLFDFLCFVNLFNQSDPQADCDADAALSLFDFLCFVNAFNLGC